MSPKPSLMNPNSFSLSSKERCSSLLIFMSLLLTLLAECLQHSYTGAPEMDAVFHMGSHESRGGESPPSMLLLVQPRMQLGFWASSTHCWIILDFTSATNTPGLYPQGCSPSILCSEVIRIAQTQVQNLSHSLAALHKVAMSPPLKGPSGWHLSPTACCPHSLMPSADLLRAHSIPLFTLADRGA